MKSTKPWTKNCRKIQAEIILLVWRKKMSLNKNQSCYGRRERLQMTSKNVFNFSPSVTKCHKTILKYWRHLFNWSLIKICHKLLYSFPYLGEFIKCLQYLFTIKCLQHLSTIKCLQYRSKIAFACNGMSRRFVYNLMSTILDLQFNRKIW